MPIYKWNEVREVEKSFTAEHFDYSTAADTGTHEPVITESDRNAVEELRKQAAQEAENIKQEALSAADLAKKQAYEEGYSKAQSEVKAKFNENLQKSFSAIQEALAQRNAIIKTAEPEILKLSVKIAQQLIQSEITLNKGIIMNVVSDAINKITDREQVIIKINPADLETVKDFKDDIEDMLDGAKNLSIVGDKKIDIGGCIVETKVGLVDARVSTKVQAIENAFMKVYSDKDNENEKQLKEDAAAAESSSDQASAADDLSGNIENNNQEQLGSETAEEEDSEDEFEFDDEDLDLDLDFDEEDTEQMG